MSTEYTPTTNDFRDAWVDARAHSIQQIPLARAEFDRWHEGEIEAAVQQGYKEALRNAAEQCANYSGHPYNAAATLGLAFSMAADKMEKED